MISPDAARKAMRDGARARKRIEQEKEQARLKSVEQDRKYTRNVRLPEALKKIDEGITEAAIAGKIAYTFEDSNEYLIDLLQESLKDSGFIIGRDYEHVPEYRGGYDEQSWDAYVNYKLTLQWKEE